MKQCPACRRPYYDDSLNFCLDDGETLIYGPAEPPTALLSGDSLPSEAKTRALSDRGTTDQTLHDGAHKGRPSGVPNKLKAVIAGAIAAVLIAVGYAAYLSSGNTASGSKQIDSLAVLPFVNVGGSSDLEYLSDGITESLINSLSKLPKLSVKGRSSVFTYKGKEITPQQVARDLSVEAVLSGRVLQRGDELILSLELVDAATGDHIWGEQYTRRLRDLTALQSEIGRDVSQKLQIRLSGADQTRLAKNHTENTEAYQLYLRGRYHWNKRTESDIRKSAEYFQQAIDKDPTYALAYAGLAEAYILFAVYTQESHHDSFPRARAAALRALEMDSELAEAHTALATFYSDYDWDFKKADESYRRAIEANPNYATAHHWYGEFLLALGRPQEALASLERARELDPLSLIINNMVGLMYRFNGRHDEAIQQVRKTIDMDPNFQRARLTLVQVYEDKGMIDGIAEEYTKFFSLIGMPPEKAENIVDRLRAAHKSGGMKAYHREHAQILEELQGIKGTASPPMTSIAEQYAMAGDSDKAIQVLQKALESHKPDMVRVKSPTFASLRPDPRYQEILRRMNMPQ